ncbi:hypothetical protein KM043_012634 [Ampulex compressa]|uniref:Venom protein n=1 Tax=Ampulex compressa TaxID=860918 RepID=A0A1W6EVS0_AMPCP|nr:venom protein [Ampulex compressa]KAG7212309.1 hypothetical protein KM043_012634 [Ampulex compressa]
MCFVTPLPVILIFEVLLLRGSLAEIASPDHVETWCGQTVPHICWDPEEVLRCNVPDNVCTPYIEGSKLNFPEIDDSSIAIVRK